jgi:hypothetical protein
MTQSAEQGDLEYPELYAAAEAASEGEQKTFYRVKVIELVGLTLGAVFGLLDGDKFGRAGPILAVLMFALALGLQVSRTSQQAERRWYDARAAAESIKSSSWQYAVGGESFRLGSDDPEDEFLERLYEVLRGLPHLDIGAATAVSAGVTGDMRTLRVSNQEDRYARYYSARIEEQVGWYTHKANWNKKRSRLWRGVLIALESAALIAGLARIGGHTGIDLLGVLATAGAGVLAWMQTKNYTQLAESYAVTSHEVGLVAQAVRAGVNEEEWAQSIHDAEAAFSREHTMWVARRQGRQA